MMKMMMMMMKMMMLMKMMMMMMMLMMMTLTVVQMSSDGRWQMDAADQNFDYMFKLLIIGNSSVGKTSSRRRKTS